MQKVSQFAINAPRVVHETIDGETVIIDFESGCYYSTDKTGADIWEALAQGATFIDLVQAYAKRQPADRVQIEKQVQSFLDELQGEELIVPATTDSSWSETALSRDNAPFEPPVLNRFTDMQDLLLLDPIHEVDNEGWPVRKA